MNPARLSRHRLPLRLLLALCLQSIAALGLAQNEQVIRYDGGSDDRAHAVVTDAAGAIYVGGAARGASSTVAFTVLKHNAQGSLQWASRYSGPASHIDGNAASIGTDAAGNVYAAGYIARQLTFLQHAIDWLVVSFAPNGSQRWSHVFSSPGEGFDQASALIVDPAGAVYVTGVTGSGNNFDWLTIKYALDGTVLWQRTKSGALAGDDRPGAMKLDASGNLVILGYTSNTSSGFKDVTLVKYDPQGNLLWSSDFATAPNSDEFPSGLALDAGGNAYVTGIVAPNGDPEGPQTPFLAKFAANGTLLYAFQGEGFGGSSVAIGPDGNIVTAGVDMGAAASFIHATVAKLTPAGTPLWSVRLDPTGNTFYEGSVAAGTDGSVYFGGHVVTPFGFEFFAAKFTAGGQEVWRRVTPETFAARSVHLAANDDLFIAGENDGSRTDMVIVRLSGNAVPLLPPAAPNGLALASGKNQLKLFWSDNANNETGYRVERSVNGAAFAQVAQVATNVTTYTDTGVNKKNNYAYRVRAFNPAGNSAYSATVTGKPQ